MLQDQRKLWVEVSIPKNEFLHKNIDMNANDQCKQGPETEIGTENPNGPKSEDTDGANVGTDVISPRECWGYIIT